MSKTKTKPRVMPSQSYLRECFECDADTGVLIVSGLVDALENIAALETEYPNATVRNMATIARQALDTFKGGEDE